MQPDDLPLEDPLFDQDHRLTAADHKRHVAECQAQLADINAHQAAAVVAANSGSRTLPAAVPDRRAASVPNPAEGKQKQKPLRISVGVYRFGSVEALASPGGRGGSGTAGLTATGLRAGRPGSSKWQRLPPSQSHHDTAGGDDDVDAALLLASLQEQQPGQWPGRLQRDNKMVSSGSGTGEQKRTAAAGQGGGSAPLAGSANSSKKKQKKKPSARGAAARLL
eukprot:gene2552-2854_t